MENILIRKFKLAPSEYEKDIEILNEKNEAFLCKELQIRVYDDQNNETHLDVKRITILGNPMVKGNEIHVSISH